MCLFWRCKTQVEKGKAVADDHKGCPSVAGVDLVPAVADSVAVKTRKFRRTMGKRSQLSNGNQLRNYESV